jgi:hypothetical protein
MVIDQNTYVILGPPVHYMHKGNDYGPRMIAVEKFQSFRFHQRLEGKHISCMVLSLIVFYCKLQ